MTKSKRFNRNVQLACRAEARSGAESEGWWLGAELNTTNFRKPLEINCLKHR
jgi:uncharacterized membrane protein